MSLPLPVALEPSVCRELLLLEAYLLLSELLHANLLSGRRARPRCLLVADLHLEEATCALLFPLEQALSSAA